MGSESWLRQWLRRIRGIARVLVNSCTEAPTWVEKSLTALFGLGVLAVAIYAWSNWGVRWSLIIVALGIIVPITWRLAGEKYDRDQWDVALLEQPREQGHGQLVLGVRVVNNGPPSSFEVKVAHDSLTGAGHPKPARWGGFYLGWGGGGGRVEPIARDDASQAVFGILQSNAPHSRLMLNGADGYHESLTPDLPMYGVLEVRDTKRDTRPKRWRFAVEDDELGMKLRVQRMESPKG